MISRYVYTPIISRMNLTLLIFIGVLLVNAEVKRPLSNDTTIAYGCPNIELFQNSSAIEHLDARQLARLTCFCGPPAQDSQSKEMIRIADKVSLTCIFGSKVEDLRNALDSIRMANKTVERVMSLLNSCKFC